jgi:sugar O-acyltransferase (sialic acid O-acetyltransferase NeuD family)
MRAKAEPIILVGGFSEVIELAVECGKRVVGLIDPHLRGEHYGFPLLGDDSEAGAIRERHPGVPVIVAVDEPEHRARLVAMYEEAGFSFASLVHPQAKVSSTAAIGEGVVVQYGAHVSAQVRLQDHVRVNVYANVMHDVHVGRCSTIAPNAVVLGRVRIGEQCYIGAHATILPELEIGARSSIGAHANVTRNVKAGSVMVGNPARARRRR